jgi:hypothetical protein
VICNTASSKAQALVEQVLQAKNAEAVEKLLATGIAGISG